MKKVIRTQIREAIGAMSPEMRQNESEAICRQVLASAEWQQARTVLLYCAMSDEVSLRGLIDAATPDNEVATSINNEGMGKRIVLPVVDGDNLLLRLYDPMHMAVQGRFQIEEPTDACQLFTDLRSIDLALIPGRAFTPDGDRLGRGKGYYDKLLPQLTCPKWGVGFRCQLLPALPTDPWDIRMDRVFP